MSVRPRVGANRLIFIAHLERAAERHALYVIDCLHLKVRRLEQLLEHLAVFLVPVADGRLAELLFGDCKVRRTRRSTPRKGHGAAAKERPSGRPTFISHIGSR